MPHGRPNDVWGFVLPGAVATKVVVRLKVLWLNGKQPLKFTSVNLAVKQYSTKVRLEPNELSGVISLGRTTILGSLAGNGPRFNALGLQLHNLVQKLYQEGALTWSVKLSSNWAR